MPTSSSQNTTPEQLRMQEHREHKRHWLRWGPYLSERQWGTVREDYSGNGDAWAYLPHYLSHQRAYRWGEDGIGGLSDNHQRLCFSFAFWNHRDPILKERLFGLSNPQGNHGEDVKELYAYPENTPTHSYMRFRYFYPQQEFPYKQLVENNAQRGPHDFEYELADTGVLDDREVFDLSWEYAKADDCDIRIRLTARNLGNRQAPLMVLPSLWFRNTWTWDHDENPPWMEAEGDCDIRACHPSLGTYLMSVDGEGTRMFTDNETRPGGWYGDRDIYKDGFQEAALQGDSRPAGRRHGTKAGWLIPMQLEAGAETTLTLRLCREDQLADSSDTQSVLDQRRSEMFQFYDAHLPAKSTEAEKTFIRQSWSSLLWSKQFYHLDILTWLDGDSAHPPPPQERQQGRNHTWQHLYSDDILLVPDSWEYPWFAAWDQAYHAIALAPVDLHFALRQIEVLTREWFMHPNGQIPAYEWDFCDNNPPVQAWAALDIYQQLDPEKRPECLPFLERLFHKLLMNFTWWVNRTDEHGNNLFEGGFLGLDNIGVFDRSADIPGGGRLEQSDATGWMASYALCMLKMAVILSEHNPAFEDTASKFFEHFLRIANSLHGGRHGGAALWDEQDQFYYDRLRLPDGSTHSLKVKSWVGLIPLFAMAQLDKETLNRLPDFRRRLDWFLANRPDMARHMVCRFTGDGESSCMLSLVSEDSLRAILKPLLDEDEFLSPSGIRSLSKYHEKHPFSLNVHGTDFSVRYVSGESTTRMFGGNSNWRGPVWIPLNYSLVRTLEKLHTFYGPEFKAECPTGSGTAFTLQEIADELKRRIRNGVREAGLPHDILTSDPDDPAYHFFEYFDGDSGRGLGACHQTGWTSLVSLMFDDDGA